MRALIVSPGLPLDVAVAISRQSLPILRLRIVRLGSPPEGGVMPGPRHRHYSTRFLQASLGVATCRRGSSGFDHTRTELLPNSVIVTPVSRCSAPLSKTAPRATMLAKATQAKTTAA